MNITKTYTVGNVTFKPASRKWHFAVGSNTVIVACKGKSAAFLVANAIAAGDKRTKGNGIDGLTRHAINRILNPAEVE